MGFGGPCPRRLGARFGTSGARVDLEIPAPVLTKFFADRHGQLPSSRSAGVRRSPFPRNPSRRGPALVTVQFRVFCTDLITTIYVRGTQGDLQRAVQERAWA